MDIAVDSSDLLDKLQKLRKGVYESEREIVEQGQSALQYLARSTVLSGSVPGFAGPNSTGKTAAEGLFNSIHKGKGKVIGTSWHPLANAFENFKRRQQVHWLKFLSKDFKSSSIMDRIANQVIDKATEDSGLT